MKLMALSFYKPLVAGLILLLTACGGEEASPPAKSPRSSSSAEGMDPNGRRMPAQPPKPITSLRRAEVKATIAQGLGIFLQNITVEDWPVMHEGKFHGFKIRSLNPEWGIDLRPGDVVTKINGIVPEHPEEADAALHSLEKATALKVEFEREGKAKTLELPIVD
jgi:type II secretory pathway component PulC